MSFKSVGEQLTRLKRKVVNDYNKDIYNMPHLVDLRWVKYALGIPHNSPACVEQEPETEKWRLEDMSDQRGELVSGLLIDTASLLAAIVSSQLSLLEILVHPNHAFAIAGAGMTGMLLSVRAAIKGGGIAGEAIQKLNELHGVESLGKLSDVYAPPENQKTAQRTHSRGHRSINLFDI